MSDRGKEGGVHGKGSQKSNTHTENPEHVGSHSSACQTPGWGCDTCGDKRFGEVTNTRTPPACLQLEPLSSNKKEQGKKKKTASVG